MNAQNVTRGGLYLMSGVRIEMNEEYFTSNLATFCDLNMVVNCCSKLKFATFVAPCFVCRSSKQ
jgi:hypothetical protein